MKKIRLKILAALMAFALAALLTGCSENTQQGGAEQPESDIPAQDDIVILFTNDVHCAVDTDIGYAGLVAYRELVEQRTEYVALVDCGDALQGDAIGTISQGQYLVDIMNEVGYDFAVLGNHEFDYGMEQLEFLLSISDAQYLGCNIVYSGEEENALSAVKPYEIVSYGDVSVGFVGVSTPESIVKSTPSYFMDDSGEYVYSFCGGSGQELYDQVQQTVEQCRDQGADYVVALAHLGTDEASEPFRSTDLIANTSGIDVVLDGHSHSVIPCDIVKNVDGENVFLSSTGTGMENIGQLIIESDGTINIGLISGFADLDADMENYIGDIQAQFQTELDTVVANSQVALTTMSDTGVRLVRNRETNIGDFCADAYRAVSGADIAMVNGGGIRADISQGDVTYGDIIAVHPYGNTLCVAEATGQEILDALEMASRSTLPETGDGENAAGENGGFLQVSGLMYTIDTSVETSVETDEAGMFVSVGDTRRVKDVYVLAEDGTWEPIDPEQTYTVASHNYLIKDGGDGLNMFMDNTLVIDEGMLDYQILITYMVDNLEGNIGQEYAQEQGRITVE